MNLEKVFERLKNQDGHVGFYYENLVTGETAGFNEDQSFLAASVIKLPILMCVAKWVSEGKADFSEKIRVREEDKFPSCGALSLFSDEFDVDIRSLCNLMIDISDNSATNLLIKRFGIAEFQKEFSNIGLKNTILNRAIFDAEMAAKGYENYIVPVEIADLLRKVYKKEFVNQETSELIEEILLKQQLNSKIPAIIGEDTVPIAHKTGEDDGISNDVGIVYSTEPFILCFTGNLSDIYNWENLIREVSFEIFENSR